MTDDEIMGCVRKAVEYWLWDRGAPVGRRPRIDRPADRRAGAPDQEPKPGWPSRLAWANARTRSWPPGGRPGPTATCCGSRPPTASCTSGFIRRDVAAQPCADSHTACAGCTLGTDRRVPATMRLAILGTLRRLGYEVGSGVMIGIPGQTYDDLADDIELFGRLNLDMIGVGPYLPHPETPLADREAYPDCPGRPTGAGHRADDLQGDCAGPAGLSAGEHSRHHGAGHAQPQRGAGTGLGARGQRGDAQPHPAEYRALYEIYPDKACIAETGETCQYCLTARIEALGRQVGQGRGDSPNYEGRTTSADCPDRIAN